MGWRTGAGRPRWAAGGLVLLAAAGAVAPVTSADQAVVATYNLWNIMFNWDIRKLRIAQMVKEAYPDVVGLQEVRGHADSGLSQVTDLKELLPQYPYIHFEAAGLVMPHKEVYNTGWELEGLGLLSRHPIHSTQMYRLSSQQGPDKNTRILLRAVVAVPNLGTINVIVVHFSYDRVQQCSNAAQLLRFIEEKKLERVIVLGDFNTYLDYEWPLMIAMGRATDLNNRCPPQYRRRHLVASPDSSLVDSWKAVRSHKPGLTFSNMPMPGLESRPDRVLVCERFRVVSASVMGNGSVYRQRYFLHIWWNRFDNFLAAAWDSYHGESGRSCLHDCGPHASCRCGVCVSGGDGAYCPLPACGECSPVTLLLVGIALVTVVALLAQLIYALLQVLHAMNKRSPDGLGPFMAFNCCLCNPRLYAVPTLTRRLRHSQLTRLWPCFRLPPVFLIVVSVLLAFLWLEVVLFVFREALQDINGILPEEMYPSDHLFLVVALQKAGPGS